MGEDLRLFWGRLIRKAWDKGLAHPKHQLLCVLLSRGPGSLSESDSPQLLVLCVHPHPLQPGTPISFLSPSLRLSECWLLFHVGKIVPTSNSPASSLLLVDTGGWRRDCKYIRSVLLLDTLLHLACFPNRCRFLHCYFFITKTVFKIRIVLESLFIVLLKFVMWAP